MYKIRAILDVKKDVIRDVLIDSSNTLEDLHTIIANAFGFNGQEMASFYRTDDEWNQGEEIPLFDMSDAGESISMQKCILVENLTKVGDKFIYVYDFMSMWTFFIELSESNIKTESNLPSIAFSFGDVPETAPEKEFVADKSEDPFGLDDDEFDNFGSFENIDDYDF
ncbi:MAG: hypothetical protein COA67_04895 [Lutibacter sp.]|nr:MAG: hypothetical protein COA67_04895 [Lutibacter sp.]